jgi:DNA-directed RNA polymerase subunit RPC12/RpoP
MVAMFMNVVCPICGQKCRVPESALGQIMKCPACSGRFQCGTQSPRSLETFPIPDEATAQVHGSPQVKTADVVASSVHYRCPRCSKHLESPLHLAGTKANCPDCGQRLQIPQASETASAPVVNPAPMAIDQRPAVPDAYARIAGPPLHSTPTTQPAPIVYSVVPTVDQQAPARIESCLECGVDLARRGRVHTCPDCGSLLCSASCFREHRYHAHPPRR